MVRSREDILEYQKEWKNKNPNYMKEWEKNHPERKDYHKKKITRYRMEALNHYCGNNNLGPWCQCCGITEVEFLTIDHMDDNGAKHRREINSRGGTDFYLWLRRNHWPDGYQVLCFNCNLARGYHGYCPHKI